MAEKDKTSFTTTPKKIFINDANGKVEVRGLLPGGQLVQMPERDLDPMEQTFSSQSSPLNPVAGAKVLGGGSTSLPIPQLTVNWAKDTPMVPQQPSLQTTPSSSNTYCIAVGVSLDAVRYPNIKNIPTATPIQHKTPSPLTPTPIPAPAAPTATRAVTPAKQNTVTGIQTLGLGPYIVTIKDDQLVVQGPDHAYATKIARGLCSGAVKLANLNGKQVLVKSQPPPLVPTECNWPCPDPTCGNVNFSLRTSCSQCKVDRPVDGKTIKAPTSSCHHGSLKNKLQKQMEKPLVKDDAWYLLGSRWFNQAKQYLALEGEVVETSNPGPIDNRGLWREDGTDIRELMIKEVDYLLVPEEAWFGLEKQFGVKDNMEGRSTAIRRKVVEHDMFMSKQLSVEVYYIELELVERSNLENTKKRKFSKSETLELIQGVMREEFSIPAEADTCLWHKFNSNEYKQLARLDNTVQDAGLSNGDLIIIEQKNKDGSWPRQAWTSSKEQMPKETLAESRVKYEQELKEMKKTQAEKISALVESNRKRRMQVENENESKMTKMRVAYEKRVEKVNTENESRMERVDTENAELVNQLTRQNNADSEKVMARQRKDESVMRQEDSQVSAPECPVCLDQMLPPLRIFQCRDGHLICEICRDGLQATKCPECRGTMTGRATGMEQFLRTIH